MGPQVGGACRRLGVGETAHSLSNRYPFESKLTEPIGVEGEIFESLPQRTLIGYPMPLPGYPMPYPATRWLGEAKLRSAAEQSAAGDPVHCPPDLTTHARM